MCVKLISAAWQVKLSSASKLILVFLADMANPANDDACWPSIAYIVKHTGLSERTVQTHLKLLEKAGHITMVPRKGTSTNYFVHPRNGSTPENTAPVQRSAEGGANKAEYSRSSRTQTVIHNNNGEPHQFDPKNWLIDPPIPPLYKLNSDHEASTKRRETKMRRPLTILPAQFMTKFID